MGVANERSIAWGISQKLAEAGAELAFTYLGDALKKRVIPLAEKLNSKVTFSCDVEKKEEVVKLFEDIKKKIRVNAISAGPIKTLAASAIGDAKFLYKWNEDHSFLKRNVDIHDVGNSALYLLSSLAAGVTGEIHYVDAGYNKVGMPDPKNMA